MNLQTLCQFETRSLIGSVLDTKSVFGGGVEQFMDR